ncbi:uncharacterized protein LOC135400929 isoform X2 [Ornithodoros turicata]|uniref:uncharacterized protein LOC135400929 isoform X2 n=1 Tax=Ornithodoros turicata TaxID=34597 RepID=UPI003138B4CF
MLGPDLLVLQVNLPDSDCTKDPLTLETNATGSAATGELRVWVKATTTLADSCEILVWTPHDTGLVLSFIDMYLRPPHIPGACVDHLMLFEATRGSTVPLNRLFGTCTMDTASGLYYTQTETDVMLHVRLTVGERDNQSIVGYHLHYSTYQATNGSCPSKDQFQCKDMHCIWKGLVCDDMQNCLDNSDEFHYSYAMCRQKLNYGLAMLGYFAAIAATVLLLLTVDALLRFLLYSWRVRRMQFRNGRPSRKAAEIFRGNEEPTPLQTPGTQVHPLDRDLALLEERHKSNIPTNEGSDSKDAARKPILKHGSNQGSPAQSADNTGNEQNVVDISSRATATETQKRPTSSASITAITREDDELVIIGRSTGTAQPPSSLLDAASHLLEETDTALQTTRADSPTKSKDKTENMDIERPESAGSMSISLQEMCLVEENADKITIPDNDTTDDETSVPQKKRRSKFKKLLGRLHSQGK